MLTVEHEIELPQSGRKVLLVEDDQMVSSLIKSYLDRLGFQVHQDFTGESIQHTLGKEQPDVILLDLGLPVIDGFHVCHQIREIFSGPIVVLTARSKDADQVAAFKLGADDYIIKPVSPAILQVRIEALLRRLPTQDSTGNPSELVVGDIAIYPHANKCLVDGERVQLSSFEFRLLTLLLRNSGQVMTRDSIYNLLLGREYNGVERTVDVRISKLRDKLTSEGMTKTKIETVWGKGYILNELAS